MSITKEHVSALMDNQESSDVICEISQDQTSLETWSRYHLIGDVLRNEPSVSNSLEKQLSFDIFAALENEPVHSIEPVEETYDVASNIIPFRARLKKVISTIGQYGIAASVAVGVLVGVQQWQSTQNTPESVPHPVFNTIPVSGSATPVSINLNNERMTVLPPQMTEQQLQEERQQMAKYIHDHQLQQRLTISQR